MIDNFDIYDAYERQQEKMLEKLPKCEICGEAIQQEKAIYYSDQWVCKGCEADFWQEIREDFLEEVVFEDE